MVVVANRSTAAFRHRRVLADLAWGERRPSGLAWAGGGRGIPEHVVGARDRQHAFDEQQRGGNSSRVHRDVSTTPDARGSAGVALYRRPLVRLGFLEGRRLSQPGPAMD